MRKPPAARADTVGAEVANPVVEAAQGGANGQYLLGLGIGAGLGMKQDE